jgi:AraC family transcriptional regulator, regulatory protein of adaptative response / methylphosphotriester-DNA alkyltransferase methyltransferase
MSDTLSTPVSHRQKTIAKEYIRQLDDHIMQLKEGRVDRAMQIRELAAILHIHPVHLSNTIKEVTGKSTCDLYEERLLRISKELLLETDMSIGQIAAQLTYDPSNFTKFFKQFTGITPRQFRNGQKS